MWNSGVARINAGAINQGVGDAVVGMTGAPLGLGVSKFQGQLGKTIWMSPDELIYNSTVGTLYGGRYRYVRFRSADAQVAIGNIVNWDTTLTNWERMYQVTTAETLSSVQNSMFIAGIVISLAAPGNYAFIQDVGIVPVKYSAVLTQPVPEIGMPVYASGAGDFSADVIANANPGTIGDIGLMQARYLGNAVTLPVAGALRNVSLGFKNVLG